RRKRSNKPYTSRHDMHNAYTYVITLLKVYVFQYVAADRYALNRIPVHLDPWQMRNRTFHRHQPLTQIFIDTWIRIGSCHKKILWWLGWPNYSFCRRCGKPILAFLKKRRRLSPIEKTG